MFHLVLEMFTLCDIQMRWAMTSHVIHNILTYWKIVYIFKIIEWNHLKLCMCMQTTNLKNIVQVINDINKCKYLKN